jgi:hypothetical protein
MQFKKGESREDGYRFQGYTRSKKGSPVEIWLSPEAYLRDRINSIRFKAMKRAEEGPYPFNLTNDYLVSIFPADMNCPVLGIPMVWGSEGGIEVSPSLDRIIPELGYVEGNVVWISRRANRLKSDASVEELERILSFYKNIPRGIHG